MAIQSIIDQALGNSIDQYQDDAKSERAAIDKAITQNAGGPTKAMKSDIDYMTANRDKMAQVKMPEASFSKDVPKAPAIEENNPLDAFKSYAPAFAVFGSLLTRKPLTAALNSAAAAMQAHNQGSKDAYHQKLEKFKADMETFTKQHELETDEYRANVEKAKGDISLLTALNEATAHKFQDEHMLQTMAAGQAGQMVDMIDKKTKLSQDSIKTLSAVDKQLKANNNELTPELYEKYQSDPAMKIALKAYMMTGNPRTAIGGGTMGGKSLQPKIEALQRMAYEIDPNFNPATVGLKYKGYEKEMSTVSNSAGKIQLASNILDSSLPSLMESADKLGLSDVKGINTIYNKAREQMNDSDFKNFQTQMRAVATDYGQFIGRTQGTVHSDEEALRILNESMSDLSLKGFAEAVKTEQKNVQDGIDKTLSNIESKASNKKDNDYSQEDLEHTAKVNGISVEEVKKRLGAQ